MITYTKEMLDLMSVLRRRIKAEYDIIIRFSGTDTLDTIEDLARRSADSTTKQKALELLQLSSRDITFDDLTRPGNQSIQHRQQHTETPKSQKSVRIYRGQVVT